MKKKILKIFLIILIMFVAFPKADTLAFLPKIDGLKSSSKLSNFFGKLKNNAEKAMEWVSNSKAAQLIGDGIKEAKKGIAFAKSAYAAAMEVYGKVVDTIDKVKNSAEYKAMLISKQIADASSDIQTLEEEKLTKLEELQQEMDLLETQNSAKITNINSNLDILGSETTDEKSLNEINDQLTSLQQQTQKQLQDLEQQYSQIEKEYDSKIKEKRSEILELSKSLADVANIKLVSEDAAESIKKVQSSMFTVEGEETDLSKRREKVENRKQAFSDAVDEAIYKAASGLSNISAAQEDLDSKRNTGATMPGESENTGIAAEVVLKQVDILQQYLEYTIVDLKLQTAKELASMSQTDLEVSTIENSFNFCDYTIKKKQSGLSLLEQAKNTYQNATQTISSAKENISEATASVKEQVDNVKGKYEEAKDLVNQADQVVNDIKDSASDTIENNISAFTGMI